MRVEVTGGTVTVKEAGADPATLLGGSAAAARRAQATTLQEAAR